MSLLFQIKFITEDTKVKHTNISTNQLKLNWISLETIYKSNQAAKQRELGLRIDSVLIKREMSASLF